MSFFARFGVTGSRPLHSFLAVLLLLQIYPRCCLSNVTGTVSLPFSGWYGDDGSWSTVNLQVGNPQQGVFVLPSTLIGENWVVDAAHGCLNVSKPAISTDNSATELCIMDRGGVFNNKESKTYTAEGPFVLNTRTELGMGGNGFYGLDVFGLGDGVRIGNQAVASIATTEYQTGFLGLSTIATNFTGKSVPSLLSSLHQNHTISSTSFGYTAGASYKEKKAPGSVILGGWDAGRFVPNTPEMSFQLEDSVFPYTNLHELVIDGNDAKANATNGLPGDGIKVLIDSTTPFMWLPSKVCEVLEKALSLVWDEASELYLMTEDELASLQARNGYIHFKLGDEVDKTVTLKVPFTAFALNGGTPFLPNGSTAYFPLKRATGADQYTLGRAFLQETYLRVDFGNGNFTLNQARFGEKEQIVEAATAGTATLATNDTTSGTESPAESGGNKPNSNMIIILSVVIGALILVLAGVLVSYLFRRRRRSRFNEEIKEKDETYAELEHDLKIDPGFKPAEIDSLQLQSSGPYQLMDTKADSKIKPSFFELAGSSPAISELSTLEEVSVPRPVPITKVEKTFSRAGEKPVFIERGPSTRDYHSWEKARGI